MSETVEMSIKMYSDILKRGAYTNDYVSKLGLAALNKRMEGDYEYAEAIRNVEAVLEFMEADSDSMEDKALRSAREKLAKIVDDRSRFALNSYHTYLFDFVIDTLQAYDPENPVEDYTRIPLEKSYYFASDRYGIAEVLGIKAEDVVRTLPSKLREMLIDAGLPDHPERYIIRQVVVPPASMLESLDLKNEYDAIYAGGPLVTSHLNLLFGIDGKASILVDLVRRKDLPSRVRRVLYVITNHSVYDFKCFDYGGKYESEIEYAKELGRKVG